MPNPSSHWIQILSLQLLDSIWWRMVWKSNLDRRKVVRLATGAESSKRPVLGPNEPACAVRMPQDYRRQVHGVDWHCRWEYTVVWFSGSVNSEVYLTKVLKRSIVGEPRDPNKANRIKVRQIAKFGMIVYYKIVINNLILIYIKKRYKKIYIFELRFVFAFHFSNSTHHFCLFVKWYCRKFFMK